MDQAGEDSGAQGDGAVEQHARARAGRALQAGGDGAGQAGGVSGADDAEHANLQWGGCWGPHAPCYVSNHTSTGAGVQPPPRWISGGRRRLLGRHGVGQAVSVPLVPDGDDLAAAGERADGDLEGLRHRVDGGHDAVVEAGDPALQAAVDVGDRLAHGDGGGGADGLGVPGVSPRWGAGGLMPPATCLTIHLWGWGCNPATPRGARPARAPPRARREDQAPALTCAPRVPARAAATSGESSRTSAASGAVISGTASNRRPSPPSARSRVIGPS